MTQYWTATRSRFNLWHQALGRYRRAKQAGNRIAMTEWWKDHVEVMEEILVSEILTRVVAGLGAAMDENSSDEEISPVTHTIHLNHMEARNRVQQILLLASGHSEQAATQLNRLRQGVESWTDVLIGRMSVRTRKPIQYAINGNRALAYAEEADLTGHGVDRRMSHSLMNLSMHDMIRQQTSPNTALPAANREVARSVMLMLRPELFDSVGVLKSLWMHRLENSADLTDRMLDELTLTDIHDAETVDSLELTGGSYFERWCH